MPLQRRDIHWDIFCRVIDNYGDIGVSWRLARQLACEYGATVRLWVDRPESLKALCPELNADVASQTLQGVTVLSWTAQTEFPPPATIVIEAFGCGLPPQYVAQMAAGAAVWIILEYLSAEPWVRDHHTLPSPHPQLGLPRYFFFPGIAPGTGGVLCEAGLTARRDAFDARARCAFWARHGFEDVPPDATAVSLFAYAHAPVQAWLTACARGETPVVVAVPEGTLAVRVREAFQVGMSRNHTSGNLELRFLPFVPQPGFDELLWACDINFVRGEDSFVRAQWAARPFVWHIYPQAGQAHTVKLEAFLDAYCDGLPGVAARAARDFWRAWNDAGGTPVAPAWQNFVEQRQDLMPGAQRWAQSLAHIGDLAGNLVKFCQKMI